MIRLVSGPMNATLPNLFLSDKSIMTAPGAMNLNGRSTEMAVTINPYKFARNSAQLP